MVIFPLKMVIFPLNMAIFHSYVNVYQRVSYFSQIPHGEPRKWRFHCHGDILGEFQGVTTGNDYYGKDE